MSGFAKSLPTVNKQVSFPKFAKTSEPNILGKKNKKIRTPMNIPMIMYIQLTESSNEPFIFQTTS